MNIWNKIKMVAGVLIVFLLILATNLIDKENFAKVEASVETIYQDRLLTKEMLIELTHLVHDKEIAMLKKDSTYFSGTHQNANNRIEVLIDDCSKVIATKKEERVIDDLRDECDQVYNLEKDSALFTTENEMIYVQQIESVSASLKELSDVQIEEGRKEKLVSKNAIDSAKLFARIEIYLLIFLGVIMQFAILYRPKRKKA